MQPISRVGHRLLDLAWSKLHGARTGCGIPDHPTGGAAVLVGFNPRIVTLWLK